MLILPEANKRPTECMYDTVAKKPVMHIIGAAVITQLRSVTLLQTVLKCKLAYSHENRISICDIENSELKTVHKHTQVPPQNALINTIHFQTEQGGH